MNNKIDTRNLDIKIVIKELWKHADFSNFYKDYKITKPDFIWEKGIKNIKPGGYLEIFCGKILKITVNSNSIDTSGYDNIYGKGKAAEIISKLVQ